MVAGKPTTVRFSLYPTSVLLRKGHHIRLALAGADANVFQRYPAAGTPTWTVYRGSKRDSFIDLPVRQERSLSHARSVGGSADPPRDAR